MAFDISNGLIQPARWVASPNYSARPSAGDISLLVVHNISLPPGEFGGGHVEAFFQNRLDTSLHPYFAAIAELQVSAHCLIDRAGLLVQFVNLYERAWHAGVSSFEGRPNCNDYSIGIELEGTDELAFTAAQYQTLAALARALMAEFPLITPARIVGHSHIAPGRKTDPGPAFDWDYFHGILSP
ncbi:MAG TPA: 1,6-anhydro-N-acetylmuramyl-L-alanine amidase AmpD [Cellvibrionaceae bacterium]|nr:1,6-anhydro-N-acetylmuramyl-L-alanine amidase AmpD [Cellvibrionaceae bacterium]HMY40783.1 1,6-anhydro-N-acetylmuramyl-L-alanine amidase AmpD [Marinagarivorans sp.]